METHDIFEEWCSYALGRELLHREFDLDSAVKLSSSKIVAVTGIRRSGKSSVLMLIAQKLSSAGEHVAYINVEDSRLGGRKELLDDILKWFGDSGFLLLDEVTSAADWEGWLSRVHELTKGRLKIIVSSSRSSLSSPSKPLRGRVISYELFPLSFKEFLSFKGIRPEKTTAGRGKVEKALSEYIKYGGFPEIVLAQNDTDKSLILDSYFKDIVGLDVAEASGQHISIVDSFSRYVIQSSTFSASKCLNFLKGLGYAVGKEKILELERHTESSYLAFFIPIFSRNIKDRLQYPRKSYAGDTGFYYGTTGKIDIGRAFETLVFLELKRRAKAASICYWKNSSGFEVDFIIKKGTDVSTAMQVAYEITETKTETRELRSLVSCSKDLHPAELIVLTKELKGVRKVEGVTVRLIPILEWL